MSTLPDSELDAYLTTVLDAVSLAQGGAVLDGYRNILDGQVRAHGLRQVEPWGAELCHRYAEALLRYGEQWGIRLD